MDVQETLVELLNELSELNAQYNALQEEFLISEYSHTDGVSESVSRGLDRLDLFSSGDTGFVLSCSALAMFLTLPGISLFYSGAVSIKHVMSTFIQTMAVSAVISVLWMLCGYSLVYSPSQFDINDKTTIYGDLSRGWLLGMDIDSVHQLSPTIPETAFCMFQLTPAIFACAFVIGGFACRTKFLSVLVFMSLWLLLVYCPLSHMLMHPSGWLFKADVLDFTGSNVTHISAGITALVASYYIGPRTNIQEKERFESRNILLSVWGACFVLVGWFGFNMGSSYGSGIAASRALFGSMLGASSSSVSWISVEWLRTGSPSILGILCGAIAGLVSISAGIGYIDHTGVVVTGACAGFSCYMVVEKVKRIHSVDDPLNTFSMNFVGGLVGGFLVGFFAKLDAGGTRSHPTGAFYGNANQVRISFYLSSLCNCSNFCFPCAVTDDYLLDLYSIARNRCDNCVVSSRVRVYSFISRYDHRASSS